MAVLCLTYSETINTKKKGNGIIKTTPNKLNVECYSLQQWANKYTVLKAIKNRTWQLFNKSSEKLTAWFMLKTLQKPNMI